MFTHDGAVALVKKLSLSPLSQENPREGFGHLSAHAPLHCKMERAGPPLQMKLQLVRGEQGGLPALQPFQHS